MACSIWKLAVVPLVPASSRSSSAIAISSSACDRIWLAFDEDVLNGSVDGISWVISGVKYRRRADACNLDSVGALGETPFSFLCSVPNLTSVVRARLGGLARRALNFGRGLP